MIYEDPEKERLEELKAQPEVRETPPSNDEFCLRRFATDFILSHEVGAPEILFFSVTAANIENVIPIELGFAKFGPSKDEQHFSLEHKMFDEIPIRDIVSPALVANLFLSLKI